jgi:hypothetical protein
MKIITRTLKSVFVLLSLLPTLVNADLLDETVSHLAQFDSMSEIYNSFKNKDGKKSKTVTPFPFSLVIDTQKKRLVGGDELGQLDSNKINLLFSDVNSADVKSLIDKLDISELLKDNSSRYMVLIFIIDFHPKLREKGNKAVVHLIATKKTVDLDFIVFKPSL